MTPEARQGDRILVTAGVSARRLHRRKALGYP
jgi:hypothetical protein